MGAVCRRHVLDDGGVAAYAIIASMAGHTATAMQQLDSARSDARIELESDKRVRDAVAMFIDLDVVVDVFCGRPKNTSCVAKRFLWPWR